MLNTRNDTKVYIGMIKGELYLFSNNKQSVHLPTTNVYIHIEYYFLDSCTSFRISVPYISPIMALFVTENSFFIVSCFVTNYL